MLTHSGPHVLQSLGVQLHGLAYNLASFMRALALPRGIAHWSLTTLRETRAKSAPA
jgi:hypothetical protein